MLKKLFCILLLIPGMALANDFVEGKDYQVVANLQAQTSKTPVVTEFFSYGCPWCFKMEAPLHQWLASDGKTVQVDKVPVVFKPDWENYARAYYTAKMLAMADKMSPVLFKTIQEDKKPLNTKESMVELFVSQGVDKEIAKSAFTHSPSVDMRVAEGMHRMADYQINAVPAFVVNNKYKTDLQMAGSPERLFEILNYLLKKPA